jgi:hypothetical protein
MATPLSVLRAISRVRRSIRRVFVIWAFAGYPLLLLGYATLVQPGQISSTAWAPIAVVLMSMTIFGLFAVYAFARNRAQLDGAELDERQRTLGTRSYALSYGVLMTAVWAILSPLAIAVFFGGPVTITADAIMPMIVAASVYLPALPSAALAWIEPDWQEDGR